MKKEVKATLYIDGQAVSGVCSVDPSVFNIESPKRVNTTEGLPPMGNSWSGEFKVELDEATLRMLKSLPPANNVYLNMATYDLVVERLMAIASQQEWTASPVGGVDIFVDEDVPDGVWMRATAEDFAIYKELIKNPWYKGMEITATVIESYKQSKKEIFDRFQPINITDNNGN
jgi:hypothetical protein